MCQINIENVYARKCDNCQKGFNEGFLDSGSYYCSENCLLESNKKINKDYTWAQWELDHLENDDECYYTEWYDDLDEYFLDEFGNQDIFKKDGSLINELEFNTIKKGLKNV